MGKTRTAVISGMPDEKSSGKTMYEEKRKKLAEKRAPKEKKLPAGRTGKAGKKQLAKLGLKGGERIKVVGGEILEKEPSVAKAKEGKEEKKHARPSKKRGKKYQEASAKIDKNKLYPLSEAIKLVKETSYSSFDGTVELHLIVKKEGLSFNLELPHASGKKKKIEIADNETLKKLKKGKIDFDVLLATAEMMPKLVPYAKILGPKGLMPNPKTGTLIKDLPSHKASARQVKEELVKKFSANTLNLKTERKAPVIHVSVGKISQNSKELKENTQAVIDAAGSKQINKAVLSATMGPGIKLEV